MPQQSAKLRIKDIMDAQGITRNELASRIGLDGSALSNIINNKANPTVATLGKIAAALDVRVVDLFENTPAAQPIEVGRISFMVGGVKYEGDGTVIFKPCGESSPDIQENPRE